MDQKGLTRPKFYKTTSKKMYLYEMVYQNKGWEKKPKKPNQSKNQNEIKQKTRLTKPSGLDLVFVLQNTKTMVSVNQPKKKIIYIYIYIYIYIIGFLVCVSCDFPTSTHFYPSFLLFSSKSSFYHFPPDGAFFTDTGLEPLEAVGPV